MTQDPFFLIVKCVTYILYDFCLNKCEYILLTTDFDIKDLMIIKFELSFMSAINISNVSAMHVYVDQTKR